MYHDVGRSSSLKALFYHVVALVSIVRIHCTVHCTLNFPLYYIQYYAVPLSQVGLEPRELHFFEKLINILTAVSHPLRHVFLHARMAPIKRATHGTRFFHAQMAPIKRATPGTRFFHAQMAPIKRATPGTRFFHAHMAPIKRATPGTRFFSCSNGTHKTCNSWDTFFACSNGRNGLKLNANNAVCPSMSSLAKAGKCMINQDVTKSSVRKRKASSEFNTQLVHRD